MIAPNPGNRLQPAVFNPVSQVEEMVECLHRYFHQHPQVSWKQFLMVAIQREITSGAPEIRGSRPQGRASSPWENSRRPMTAEDIRLHAWINERLALLHRKRHGWWAKLGRILLRIPIIRSPTKNCPAR